MFNHRTLPRPTPATFLTPNPEKGLTKAQREIRRALMKSERPLTDAAIEIARLRTAMEQAMKNTFTIVTTLDPETVVVTRRSMFSGINNSLVLPLSLKAFQAGIEVWSKGNVVQDAFPTLTPGQREFLQTGCTPEEWNRSFNFGDEE